MDIFILSINFNHSPRVMLQKSSEISIKRSKVKGKTKKQKQKLDTSNSKLHNHASIMETQLRKR